jgi:hypothetical protein
MIVRAALLLLALLLVLAVLGRWRRRVGRDSARPRVEAARRCPDCDAYVFGPRPEPCGRPDCRFRSA